MGREASKPHAEIGQGCRRCFDFEAVRCYNMTGNARDYPLPATGRRFKMEKDASPRLTETVRGAG